MDTFVAQFGPTGFGAASSIIPSQFLCGQVQCSSAGECARCAADGVVRGRYAVVGTIEDLPTTLGALAAALPAFFGRPFDWQHHAHPPLANENMHKGRPANATTAAILRAEPSMVAAEMLRARIRARLVEQVHHCAAADRRREGG